VMHDRQLYREFLARLPPQSAIAVEATGHYSWIVTTSARIFLSSSAFCVIER